MALELKKDSTPEFISYIDKLEKRADRCEFGLKIYKYPVNVATWAMLTQYILTIESAIQQFGFGSSRHRETMMNLGKSGAASSLPWVHKHCRPVGAQRLRWSKKLAEAALEMQNVAHNYSFFLTCFPMWHKDRDAAELVGPQHIRFSSPVEVNQRRIRAYQQGVRITNWPSTIDEPRGEDFVKDEKVIALIPRLVATCTPLGFLGFTYPEPLEPLSELNDIYRKRLESAFRWPLNLSLGGFSMEEFRIFYATLLAICSVHEHLCFRWAQKLKRYPVNSAVLAKQRDAWTNTLATLSGLQPCVVEHIMSDLTFGRIRPLDVYIHPFVPAAPNDSLLLLIPGLPLNSRADENILRVFSYTHSAEYQQFSKGKEEEMRNDLKAHNPHNFTISGPISLPGNLPDIDLLLEDAASSTLVIAEMKWTRKTVLAREHVDRDDELLYGVNVQLRRIQAFLTSNPHHLRSIGACARSLGEYARVCCLLIARDHLVWIPPEEGRYIVSYDAFKKVLSEYRSLAEGATELLKYDWLPVEGRDFTVRFETADARGVTVEAEIYHRH